MNTKLVSQPVMIKTQRPNVENVNFKPVIG